jgi:hypothetical protein
VFELIQKGYSKGIKVDLNKGLIKKSKPAQDEIFYWDIGAQNVIIASLGKYLPRVSEDKETKTGLFSKYRKKVELCSTSKALDERGVAKEEKLGLLEGIEQLEQKSKDPKIDPNAKLILKNFKLPDPEKLPEFYRLSEGRLIIIWGCETNSSDLLNAKAAVEKLKVDPWHKVFMRRLGPFLRRATTLFWLLLALILLALLLSNLPDCTHADRSIFFPSNSESNNSKKDLPQRADNNTSNGGENNGTSPPGPDSSSDKGDQDGASQPENDDSSNGGEPNEAPPPNSNGSGTNTPSSGAKEQSFDAHKVWLPVEIDSSNYHATMMTGIQSANKRHQIFLSEPGDNKLSYGTNQHYFTPGNIVPTLGQINSDKNYIFYDLNLNKERKRFYIIGMLYVDFNSTSKPKNNPRNYLAAPDLSQDKYDFWESLCAPTSVSNLIWFLSSRYSPSPRPDLSPIKVYNSEIGKRRLNSIEKQAFASDLLIAGNSPKGYFQNSLASLMGSSQDGTSIDGIINGTLKFLNQNDNELSWSSELNVFPQKLDVWKCMGEALKKGTPPILFVKLDTPPKGDEKCLNARITVSPRNQASPPSTMSSVDIIVNSGSEKVANQNVSVELVAQDMKKPGNKFDQIEWHYIYNGTDRKPLGNSKIVNFSNVPGMYIIEVEGMVSGGQPFSLRKGISLGVSVSPKVELLPSK